MRIPTDPVLLIADRPAAARGPDPVRRIAGPPDLVLVSHLHRDHADLPSLRRLGRSTRLVCPQGTGRFFAKHGFTAVEELAPGGSIEVGAVVVSAVEAIHDGGRVPPLHGPAVGYLIAGTRRVYVAGDTDLFDGMGGLGAPVNVALLPIWGWGSDASAPVDLDPLRRGPGRGADPTRARSWCRSIGARSIRAS